MTREVPAADHQSKLLGTLTVTALKHLGESTLVVDEDNALAPDWRMALIGDIALLGKPADSRSPKRIDCYQVTEHGADGAAFKLDPARVVFSLRWKHNAEPPDFKLVRLREDPELWERWANGANLTLPRRIAAARAARGRLVMPVLDAFEAAMESKTARRH